MCLENITPNSGPPVILPDEDTLEPKNQGILSLSNKLTKQAQTATILPSLCSSSLISLGQFCDDECVVLLNKAKLYAIKEDEVVVEGTWNYTNGLWNIPIEKTLIKENKYCKLI